MNRLSRFTIVLALSMGVALAMSACAEVRGHGAGGRGKTDVMKPIALWPGAAPGDTGDIGVITSNGQLIEFVSSE